MLSKSSQRYFKFTRSFASWNDPTKWIFPADFKNPMPIDQPFDFEIDGLKMKNYAYPQEGDLKGVIYYVPGFGDHGKHYGYFFEQFAKAGFLTLTQDKRGFGLSEGPSARLDDNLVPDTLKFIDKTVEHYKIPETTPKFVIGTSFGGLLTPDIVHRAPKNFFAGQIMLVPFFGITPPINFFGWAVIKFLSILRPNSSVPVKLKNDMEKKKVERFLASDPILNPAYYPDSIFKMVERQEKVMREAHEYTTPSLFILGQEDVIVCNNSAKEVFNKIGAEDKTLIVQPETDHFNGAFEPEWRVTVDSIQEWIEKRI